MKILLAGLLLLGQTADVTPEEPAETVAQYDGSVSPECSCEEQCAAMWAEAVAASQRLSGMRLRIVTDFMLETYSSRDGLTATANKVPRGGGKYSIDGGLSSRYSHMAGLADRGTTLFNMAVQGAGSRIECPAPVVQVPKA